LNYKNRAKKLKLNSLCKLIENKKMKFVVVFVLLYILNISSGRNLKKNVSSTNMTDDDYFLDKRDSVVYTYLMNENVSQFYSG
jgi:hypothetical protein